MRCVSLPGARARSSSLMQAQRCLPSSSSPTSTTSAAARHHLPLRVRQRLAAQPRILSSDPPSVLQQQQQHSRRRPRGVACSASSSGGGGGNGSSEKGRGSDGGNGTIADDGSTGISSSTSTSSNPLPVPEPMPPSTRIEADLGVGEFDAFKEVSPNLKKKIKNQKKSKVPPHLLRLRQVEVPPRLEPVPEAHSRPLRLEDRAGPGVAAALRRRRRGVHR